MNHLAIYLRLSQEDENYKDESNSITNQRKLIYDYIHSHSELMEYEITEYCDDGYSGTDFERPDIKKLLKEVKQAKVQCIIVKDMSRFSRDYIELGTYMNQIFPFMGIRFIAINDRYDSKEHQGYTIEIDTAFQTLLYDLYSKDISEKVKVSIQNKCKNGEYAFGQVPFGYERCQMQKNKVIVKEEEACIVRRIFLLAEEGYTMSGIARIFHEEKVPTITQIRKPHLIGKKRALTWTSESVSAILKNRFYIGEMQYGKTRPKLVGSSKLIKVPQSEWKVIVDHHEPLVTKEVFDKVSQKRITHSTQRKGEKYLLSGKMYCGACRYALSYKPIRPSNKYRHFECRKHAKLQIPECCTYMNADYLEEMVLQTLNKVLLYMGNLDVQKENLRKTQEQTMDQLLERIGTCERDSKKLLDEKDIAYEEYVCGTLSKEEYKRLIVEKEEQKANLRAEKDTLQSQLRTMKNEYHQELDDMKKVIRYSHLEALTQEVVDIFIKRIYVYRDKHIEIEWNFTDMFRDVLAEIT